MLLRKTIHARQVSSDLNRPPNSFGFLIAWMMSMRFNPDPRSVTSSYCLNCSTSRNNSRLNRDLNGALIVEIIARCPATADVDARHTAAELGIRLSFAGRNYKHSGSFLTLWLLALGQYFFKGLHFTLSIKTERHEIAKKSV